ncbi:MULTISPECIES: ATP-binding protein [unclassified Kitasatospora]|uniref:ATP-binding protein n=1 Tax=unclassified Kitasatospora TaxID=2633591 RepID=UPI002473335E|nr:ATP-binding protein [Kitasatospora sp. MAA19]MDH6706418.1 serine/threonine-protein kinase RsbW [Kitasatospora sp. MAA19]
MCDPNLNSPSLTVSREALCDAMARAGYAHSAIVDAELALVELIVNAWRHGATAAPMVLVVIADGTLRVTVADRSSVLPEQCKPNALAQSGRGLQLVEGLTHRWGAEPQKLGKRVWFELDGAA